MHFEFRPGEVDRNGPYGGLEVLSAVESSEAYTPLPFDSDSSWITSLPRLGEVLFPSTRLVREVALLAHSRMVQRLYWYPLGIIFLSVRAWLRSGA